MNPTEGPDLSRFCFLPVAFDPVRPRSAPQRSSEAPLWPTSGAPSPKPQIGRAGYEPVLPGPFRRATSERLSAEAATSRSMRTEDARHVPGGPLESEAVRPLLQQTYGDALAHPKLHVLSGKVDLGQLPVGQWNETGRLGAVLLSPPLSLHMDAFTHSPRTAVRDARPAAALDRQRALLAAHERLLRFYLSRGIDVFLALAPETATQAVFTTDAVAALGPLAIRGNLRHDVRRVEMRSFVGGIPTALYGRHAPVEGGDLLLSGERGQLTVLQGLDSMRSSDDSIDAMGRLLRDHARRLGQLEHLVVPLRQHVVPGQAEGTLHLDYVVGYAGDEPGRALLVAPAGLADPGRSIENLQAKLRVRDRDVIEVHDDLAVIAGATNFVNLNPREVLFNDVEALRPLHEELRRRGFVVHPIDLGALSEFDGTTRCATARLLRA